MDYQQKLPGAVFRTTGADYANLVAAYVAFIVTSATL